MRYRPWRRQIIAAVLILCLLLLMAGGATIPFLFESQTMYYKFGLDKTLLRLGKIAGISAALLMAVQLLLGGRFKPVDRIYPLDKLLVLHRLSGAALLLLTLLHPLLVIVPEGLANLPIGWKFWPEYTGASLLALLLSLALSALCRSFFNIPFNSWWLGHRTGAFLAFILLLIHVRFVSETFEKGIPLQLLTLFAASYFSLIVWKLIRRYIFPSSWKVIRVERHHEALHTLTLRPLGRSSLRYLPGQFAFLSLQSDHISPEPHPFTLSSTPTSFKEITFTVRASGDWTSAVHTRLQGAKVWVDGPYGQFSHLLTAPGKGLLLIAGGIGITPMISMLRYMAAVESKHAVTLIWSCRHNKDMIFAEELKSIAEVLPDFCYHPYITSDPRSQGRLDGEKLAPLLKGCDRDSAVFVCGPPRFTDSMVQLLPGLGFSRNGIHLERFKL